MNFPTTNQIQNDQPPPSDHQQQHQTEFNDHQHQQQQPVNVRLLISLHEAGIVIGKAGQTVEQIRNETLARIRVSEYVQGSYERIVSISGSSAPSVSSALVKIAQLFSLNSRSQSGESLQEEELQTISNTVTIDLCLLCPNSLMGIVIGKQGSKIREIQERSNAKIFASETILPQSTDRSIVFSGTLQELEIALLIYCELMAGINIHHQQNAQGEGRYMPRNISYKPSAEFSLLRQLQKRKKLARTPPGKREVTSSRIPSSSTSVCAGDENSPTHNIPAEDLQEFHISSSFVGAIIGKGGSRIKEIRKASGCKISIGDVENESKERLVTISGSHEGTAAALKIIREQMEAISISVSDEQQPHQL